MCGHISVYVCISPNSVSEPADGFSRYLVRRVYSTTTANPNTLLLIFYCGAGTTSAPLTFRLEVIFINAEIFRDRNLIKALMWLFKLTEKSSWVKRAQLDVTCFIVSLFIAQHVSDVNTSILRSLGLTCWVISWDVLIWFDVCWCYVAVWLWWCGIRMQAEALLLRMDVLTSETCWAINKEIIKQVTSSWSLFTQLSRWCTVQ